jgi:hypothetical protein
MRNLLIVVAASLVFAGQVAWSQVSLPTEAPLPPMANVNLSLEQKHTIRELVKDMHLPKEGGNLKVGASVPASVVLAPMPVEIGNKVPQIKSHRLFVTGGASCWSIPMTLALRK